MTTRPRSITDRFHQDMNADKRRGDARGPINEILSPAPPCLSVLLNLTRQRGKGKRRNGQVEQLTGGDLKNGTRVSSRDDGNNVKRRRRFAWRRPVDYGARGARDAATKSKKKNGAMKHAASFRKNFSYFFIFFLLWARRSVILNDGERGLSISRFLFDAD